jgi:nitroimidazol reductase NimA-like FMN-containing flavoprotein (pyridoxamine 5'-phosphate oxidase superfamily)
LEDFHMRDDIKNMIRNGRHCVLATAADGAPYCSLMSYAPDGECRRFFMATLRNTRKFSNIISNPRVSLLIDSRDTSRPQALTIVGTAREITAEAERDSAAGLLLAAHPSLGRFIRHQDAAVICVTAGHAVFLDGLTDAHYETIGGSEI